VQKLIAGICCWLDFLQSDPEKVYSGLNNKQTWKLLKTNLAISFRNAPIFDISNVSHNK
jgi:hypothetical protein